MAKDFIEVYDNALPSEVCKHFLTLIDNAPKKRITDEDAKDIWYVRDTYLRDSNPLIVLLSKVLVDKTNDYVKRHPQLAKVNAMWNLDDNFCLQIYDPDMGYFIPHAENHGLGDRDKRRMLVWMIFLNTVTYCG